MKSRHSTDSEQRPVRLLRGLFFITTYLVAIGFGYLARELIIANSSAQWFTASEKRLVPILEALGLLLGFGAVILAILHDFAMRTQVLQVERLLTSMWTRHIGPFPRHLDQIVELIENTHAEGSIDILADCADYGSFFDPERHRKVFNALADAARREVRIRLLVCGPVHHITHNSPFWAMPFDDLLMREDFQSHLKRYIAFLRKDERFKLWLSRRRRLGAVEVHEFVEWLDHHRRSETRFGELPNPINAEKLVEYLGACCRVCDGEDLQKDDGAAFETLLFCREKYFEGLLQNDICLDLKRLPTVEANLFFWTKQDTERDAVFMFAEAGRATRGLGFRTRDTELLKVFDNVFQERYESVPQPHEEE